MPGNREFGLFNMAKSTGGRKYLAMNIWVERKSHTGEGEEPFEWGDNGGTRTNGCRLALNPFLFFFGLSHSPGRNWFSHYSKDLKKKKITVHSLLLTGGRINFETVPKWLLSQRRVLPFPGEAKHHLANIAHAKTELSHIPLKAGLEGGWREKNSMDSWFSSAPGPCVELALPFALVLQVAHLWEKNCHGDQSSRTNWFMFWCKSQVWKQSSLKKRRAFSSFHKEMGRGNYNYFLNGTNPCFLLGLASAESHF